MSYHQVIFVTDPLCSWCWGMLPEMEKVKATLEPDIHFDLMMAGLQIGKRQLVNYPRLPGNSDFLPQILNKNY